MIHARAEVGKHVTVIHLVRLEGEKRVPMIHAEKLKRGKTCTPGSPRMNNGWWTCIHGSYSQTHGGEHVYKSRDPPLYESKGRKRRMYV